MTSPDPVVEGAVKNAFAPSLPVGAANIFCRSYKFYH